MKSPSIKLYIAVLLIAVLPLAWNVWEELRNGIDDPVRMLVNLTAAIFMIWVAFHMKSELDLHHRPDPKEEGMGKRPKERENEE